MWYTYSEHLLKRTRFRPSNYKKDSRMTFCNGIQNGYIQNRKKKYIWALLKSFFMSKTFIINYFLLIIIIYNYNIHKYTYFSAQRNLIHLMSQESYSFILIISIKWVLRESVSDPNPCFFHIISQKSWIQIYDSISLRFFFAFWRTLVIISG